MSYFKTKQSQYVMLLSKRCEYGLRAALYLATEDLDGYVAIRDVSRALGIPYHFLAKIVQDLIGAGLLTSHRGPAGGVALARPTTRITLREIVLALDGPGVFTACVLGLPGCGLQRPCPLHDQWAETRDRFHRMFEEATLGSMAARIKANGFRLSDVPLEEAVEPLKVRNGMAARGILGSVSPK